MNEIGDNPRRDDPIHQLFRKLREGFSDIVVNLVERVDRRVQLFIEDERHQPPSTDDIAIEAIRDVASVFSALIPPTDNARPNVEPADEDADDER